MRWGTFFGPIILAQFPLDAVHDGRGHVTEIGIAVAIFIQETGM
jgi:hypothetical protein